MVKKALIATGGLGLLTVVFFGSDAASYVCTSAGRVSDSVRDSVPMEFEIDRARRMVQNLVPDIRRNMHVIAKEEVEVERLEDQISRSEAQLDEDRNGLVHLRKDLTKGLVSYRYANRQYSADQVKTDLARRFERFKTNDATLASLRDIHQARMRSLDAARQKLQGMLAAKRQLEVDVENLEARMKMVEVAQTTSQFNFDDSRLARAKDLVAGVRARLSVAEKLVNADVAYADEIPLDGPAPDDIVEQITEYFELGGSEVERVADAAL